MKKLGRFKTLTIGSLSAIAIATPIVLAQTARTDQDTNQTPRAERRGHGEAHGEGWGGRGGRGDRMHGDMFGGITLTEDQKTRMKQISQSFRERTQSLRQGLQEKQQQLHQSTDSGTFNEALAQQTASLQAKLMGERFKMRQEMQAVLTPEQKTQIEQKRAEFKSKRGERGESGRQKVQ